ncbi:DoxX family protein, partial [Blastomonas sp. CCH15-G10]
MEAATVKGKAKGVQPRPLPPALRITFRVWLKLYAALIASARPLFDLAVRLIIAQGLLASGLVKLMDWERALTLASQEYPVSFLSPPYAAALGLSIELGGAVLLALGLMTRGAALAVGALMLVAQLGYLPTDTQLFTIALMGWYAMRGAGALSLDR